ncbi:MAG: gephyrin-like molybdotransferase Glp [Bacteroidota bacterium]
MISAEDALHIILDVTPRMDVKKISLLKADGRILAEDIVARHPLPPFDNSSMDGYAVATKSGGGAPVILRVIGEASAGNPFDGRVDESDAVRVMTGGVIPQGTSSVVPIEQVTTLSEDRIEIREAIHHGANIRKTGEDIQAGERVLQMGTRIGPAQTGILAALGMGKVHVFKQPAINILATGNELVDVEDELHDGQIRNSTSYALASYVKEAGGTPRLCGTVADKRKRIRKAIGEVLDCDILLITGGVSVGDYDHVKQALEELGAERRFWRVNIKPGKPLVFATFGKTLIFGLPGNPVSTTVTFLEFIRPAINKMTGREPVLPELVQARIEHDFEKHDKKRHFLRGIATIVQGTLVVRTTGTQSSGALSSMSRANCFIVIPESVTEVKRGEMVQVALFNPFHS